MQLVGPYARLMPLPHSIRKFNEADGVALLQHIEWCARISHRSEDAQTDDSYDRFLRSVVLGHGDWSVVEHASVSVDFLVDRGITHELVRHRLFSYTQESTRFVNYEKKMPPKFIFPGTPGGDATEIWQEAIVDAEASYKALTALGVTPQIARSVLPNALASRIIVTGNLRNWRHFLLMRTTKETHPQMRQVTIPLLGEFKQNIPVLYEDIEPMAKQADNLRRGR